MLQLSFVNFKANTYITIEGTTATDRFFIIQSGQVCVYRSLNLPGGVNQFYGPGDFVAVIPCMSSHGSTESVLAMTDVVAIMVKKDQYPELIMRNTPVAMKIVRSFALTMRALNDNLTKASTAKVTTSSPEEIFGIAKFYERSGLLDIACYGYYQYLKACPHGLNFEYAKQAFIKLKPRTNPPYLEPKADATIRLYHKDSMIFSECQAGSDMFIIQEGSVKITKVVNDKEVTLAILRKGDMFGEMALLEHKPRSASAIAHEDCRLLTVNKENFDQMVSTQPQMIARLTTMFAERLWALYRQLSNTQLTDPKEKMVDMLALQIEKLKVTPVKGNTFVSDLTVQDIAAMCGMNQQEQSMAYYQLSQDQNLKITQGKIEVKDLKELFSQAAFYRKQNARRAK